MCDMVEVGYVEKVERERGSWTVDIASLGKVGQEPVSDELVGQ